MIYFELRLKFVYVQTAIRSVDRTLKILWDFVIKMDYLIRDKILDEVSVNKIKRESAKE